MQHLRTLMRDYRLAMIFGAKISMKRVLKLTTNSMALYKFRTLQQTEPIKDKQHYFAYAQQ